MGKARQFTITLASILAPALATPEVLAQEGGQGAPGDTPPAGGSAPAGGNSSAGSGSTGAASGGTGTTIVVTPPPATTTTQTTVTPFGLPTGDVNPNDTTVGFQLQGAGSTASVQGGQNGSYILTGKASGVPLYHVVARGDTLWDLCDRYYQNPWSWPKVWSHNPHVENPHWIYPGDRLRLRDGVEGAPTIRGNTAWNQAKTVPTGTVFLRDRGYIDSVKEQVWGSLDGSPDDQMLLSDGDEVYLTVTGQRDIKPGQELSLFRLTRKPEEGQGQVVTIKGSVKVTGWDPKTKIANARITESLDVIERGDLIGPIGRRFDVVRPVANQHNVQAKITAAIEPLELIGQHHVVFIDKGSKDGLVPGNRLFAVQKGDRWQATIKNGADSAAHRIQYRLKDADIDAAPNTMKGKKPPSEVVGEIRVLRTKRNSAICIVTSTDFELEPGQIVVSRRGY